ncbi:MAG: hypothetical protein REI12_08390 [Pedobacter sp.]|nr:hypothetical protein [Pedobacter sp.]
MKKVTGKKIKKLLKSTLTELSSFYSPHFERSFLIKDLDECISHMRHEEIESIRRNTEALPDEFSLANVGTVCLSLLSLSLHEPDKPNQLFEPDWLSETSIPNPNHVLQCMLAQLTNYSAGTIDLLEKGLDNPARANCRLIHELSMQIICLLFSRDDFKKYISGREEEASTQIWHELFAKDRLNKKIANIEKELGLDDEIIRESLDGRKSNYKFYSQAIHHSYLACTIGAYSPAFGRDDGSFCLLGGENENIRSTLKYLNFSIWYFLLSFFAVLDKHHNIKPKISKNSLWMEAFMLYFCVKEGYLEIYKTGK